MAVDGVIFDLDGTLIDSNALHVEAFRQVFERHGYRVEPDRIAMEIGKGGDTLVPAVLGRAANERVGEAIRAAHPTAFQALVERAGEIRVFPGARELIRAVRGRGMKAIVATSSGKSHLAVVKRYAKLDLEAEADVVVTSDDAATSKPAPDLVVAAAKKAGLAPAQCVMIGDTAYDATAAKHAGVGCVGLESGGHAVADLLRAGARQVCRDVGDVLNGLDDVLRTASPVAIRLDRAALERMMREALAAAAEGMAGGEAPIGAALFTGDGTLVARGHNRMNQTLNRTAHAEIVLFANAAGKVEPPDRRDLILASTLEPCVMCTGAAMEAAVDLVVYGLRAPADNGTGRVDPPQSPESQMPRIVGDVLAAESRALFERWLDRNRHTPQAAYVKQLMALTGR